MVTKGYGFTVNDIDFSNPSELEPYAQAYRLENKERDAEMHAWIGSYMISAIAVSVEKVIFGRKSKLEYIKKPIIEQIEEENRVLTDEDIQKLREQLMNKLINMQKTFEANHTDEIHKDGK